MFLWFPNDLDLIRSLQSLGLRQTRFVNPNEFQRDETEARVEKKRTPNRVGARLYTWIDVIASYCDRSAET